MARYYCACYLVLPRSTLSCTGCLVMALVLVISLSVDSFGGAIDDGMSPLPHATGFFHVTHQGYHATSMISIVGLRLRGKGFIQSCSFTSLRCNSYNCFRLKTSYFIHLLFIIISESHIRLIIRQTTFDQREVLPLTNTK